MTVSARGGVFDARHAFGRAWIAAPETDVVGNRVRTRAGVPHHDLNDGIINGGQIIHRQLKVSQDPKQDYRERQDSGHDGLANEGFREIHYFDPLPALGWPAGACSIRTLPPGVTPI